jgi:glycosyltransferase involved in cell wall biosynthesis
MKKTILHFIENLGRGGAETMLVSVLKELKEYDNIIIYLFDENKYVDEINCKKSFCLQLTSIYSLPFQIKKIRKIIRENNVDLIHTHLLWPTIAARIAAPKKTPIITTIHTPINMVLGYKKWYIRFLDAFTYKLKHSYILGVSDIVLNQYFEFLKIKKSNNAFRLYTFVDENKFKRNQNTFVNTNLTFKVFTTGTLRFPKNHEYLINAFAKLKNENIELHIFGEGPKRKELENLIENTGAKVVLKGDISNIQNSIHEYDVYAMASFFEGFSLSVLEAMAMQMPLLLSDVPSFKEQGADVAIYFDLNNVDDFVNKLKLMIANKNLLQSMGKASNNRVHNNFTLQHHLQGLRKVYLDVLENNINTI